MDKSESRTKRTDNHTGLLACCQLLAAQLESSLADELAQLLPGGEQTGQQLLEQITHAARGCGMQTTIRRPGPESLASSLPAVAELRDGRYCLLAAMVHDPEPSILVQLPPAEDALQEEKIPLAQFRQLWAGGLLCFERINTALVCFSILAREHNLEVTQDRLVHEFGLSNQETAPDTLLEMAKKLGLKARVLQAQWQDLVQLGKAFPALARLKNGQHLLLTGISPGAHDTAPQLICYDPLAAADDRYQRFSRADFDQIWSGALYLFKRNYRWDDSEQPFSLRWFLPEILRQKVTFIDVALAVLFIHAISLVTPVFFQIVIDKVLVNQAFATLHTLGIGMIGALLFNACLDFLRDYLLLHASNKIDMRVTGRTFTHLVRLPLQFFEQIAAGVLAQHMQQTTKIRNFLTGSVFLTMLEATSLAIFLPFLCLYSLGLTAIVLAFTLGIGAVIFSLNGPFRRRLNNLYDAEGKRQAMLVETINGMPTVKAMALEPHLRRQWEDTVAHTIRMQFRVGKISISAKSLTRFLERMMTVILIWVGADLVFKGSMSVGALIAFQMLAGRVTSPLVRMVGLVHQYQEASLSVEKLGLVMNAKQEWSTSRHGATPSLKGDIVFDRVSFRYGPELPHVLKEVSLTIAAGSTVGIVGASGSGKTTLTRLLQKIYFPLSGTLRVNGCYLNEIDTAHLRRQLGVVLQENFLFHATIADNIRAGQAGATREQIIEAARLAGADSFIVELPQGYDTMLVEGGNNLSGGQRQRLAIARALLPQPEILILDEATSALDPESERIIRKNLSQIAAQRTVLIVTHRLSMLEQVDSILVLEQGRVAGYGPHDELLTHCQAYQRLHQEDG